MRCSASLFRNPPSAATYLLAALLVGVAVFYEELVFARVHLFPGDLHDSISYDLPLLIHLSDYLTRDGIPTWSFNHGLGQNLFPRLGDLFRAILLPLGPERVPFALAYGELLKIVLAGLFFHGFLRCHGLGRFAATAGGILYAFSSFMVLGGALGLFSTQGVHLALLLWGIERCLTTGSWLVVSLAVALIAAAQPLDLYLFGGFSAAYLAARRLGDPSSISLEAKALLGRLAMATLLGLGIGAVFFFETTAEMLTSARSGETWRYLRSARSQLFWLDTPRFMITSLTRLFSADLFGTNESFRGRWHYQEHPMLYFGLSPLLLLPQAIVAHRNRKTFALALLLGALGVVHVLLGLRNLIWLAITPYYRGLSLMFGAVLLVLGSSALDAVMKCRRLDLRLLAGTFALSGFALFLPDFLEFPVESRLRLWIVAGIAGHACLLALISTRPHERRVWSALFFVAILAEAILASRLTLRDSHPLTAEAFARLPQFSDGSLARIRKLQASSDDFFRLDKDFSSNPLDADPTEPYNDPEIQGYFGTSAFAVLNQPHYLRFLQALIGPHATSQSFRRIPGLADYPALSVLVGTRYVVSRGDFALRHSGLYSSVPGDGDIHVYRLDSALPLAFCYDAYIAEDEFMRLNELLRRKAVLAAAVVASADIERVHGKLRVAKAEEIARLGDEVGDAAYAKRDLSRLRTVKDRWYAYETDESIVPIRGGV